MQLKTNNKVRPFIFLISEWSSQNEKGGVIPRVASLRVISYMVPAGIHYTTMNNQLVEIDHRTGPRLVAKLVNDNGFIYGIVDGQRHLLPMMIYRQKVKVDTRNRNAIHNLDNQEIQDLGINFYQVIPEYREIPE